MFSKNVKVLFIEVKTGKPEDYRDSTISTTLPSAFRLYLQSNVMQISLFIYILYLHPAVTWLGEQNQYIHTYRQC